MSGHPYLSRQSIHYCCCRCKSQPQCRGLKKSHSREAIEVAGLAVWCGAQRITKLTDEQVPLPISNLASALPLEQGTIGPDNPIGPTALCLLVIRLGSILVLPLPVAREALLGLLCKFYVGHNDKFYALRAILPSHINIICGKTVNQI